ncbi:hypothetical protein RJ639_012264 [Escallonia herrerae]|uniref:Uncharacterized protein n=1 Tax=Escallonia herrerae TaxID=1293975 RepID=A0AA88VNS8_9ASTE|nr:hypothetical protein RJ639_012264 [Escallonia herrerae]
MSVEGFDDWDKDFLDQLILCEEQALSSSNPTQPPPPPPPPPQSAAQCGDISYSPPRELTQRVRDASSNHSPSAICRTRTFVVSPQSDKEQEIDRLRVRRELGRASNRLSHLEHECLELRRQIDNKDEQLRSVCLRTEAKDAEVHCAKNTNLGTAALLGQSFHFSGFHPVVLSLCRSTGKAVGVQTEKVGETTNSIVKDILTPSECSRRLLGVWDPPGGQHSGKNLFQKLFMACETDFRVLFGSLSSSMSSRPTRGSSANDSSSIMVLQHHIQAVHPLEAAKISDLYCLMTKISCDMVKLEALVEALVDLCAVQNCAVLRDTVMIEGTSSGESTASETLDPGCIPVGTRFLHAAVAHKTEVRNHDYVMPVSRVDWDSLFELLHKIAMRDNEEHVRLEAVSIMNMILMKTNAYLDREKFGRVQVFQSVSQLLKKEAGFGVQKQAVQLLYLLLNCPKLMAFFCSGCNDESKNAGAADSDATNDSDFPGFSEVLQGLADCLACSGSDTKELKLRRNAIILLAFLASSGKCGFQILLGYRLSRRTNFLALILQVLISEMDVEAPEYVQPSEVFKERTLLIREAIILLNRLVSNPQYSTQVLRVLSSSREVACLTIDIANRLSQKRKWLWQSDTTARQIRECEIVDLAWVFKKRIFTFFGDSIL